MGKSFLLCHFRLGLEMGLSGRAHTSYAPGSGFILCHTRKMKRFSGMEQNDRALPKSGFPRQATVLSLPSHLRSLWWPFKMLSGQQCGSVLGSHGQLVDWGLLVKKVFPSPPPFLVEYFQNNLSQQLLSPHHGHDFKSPT